MRQSSRSAARPGLQFKNVIIVYIRHPQPVVLIVTYGFPPYIRSLGGAIRMLMLAQYLQQHGCRVHVVCARTTHVDTFGYDDLLAQLQIDYVDDPFARRASASFAAPAAGGAPVPGLVRRLSTAFKGALKRTVLEALTPDTAILAAPAMRRAVAAVVARHPGLTLISSGPPHSAHLLGLHAKRAAPAINWIVDYRDSWNGTSLFRKRTALMQWWNVRCERRVLAACDHFTYVSAPILRHARSADPAALAARATLVMNGFGADVLARMAPRVPDAGPLRIGYFGAISDGPDSYRDPSALFEALAAAPHLDVILELYGMVDIRGPWRERLGARLLVGSQLSHGDAVAMMARMDVLMLLHTREDGAEEVVTGKVFEYIASGREILSVGPAQMAVNELLRDDPSAYCVDHTARDAMQAVIGAMAVRKQAGLSQVRSPDRIARFTREAQYQKVLDLVHAHHQEVLP